jgi:Lrp/AsnC family transcriptional regulator
VLCRTLSPQKGEIIIKLHLGMDGGASFVMEKVLELDQLDRRILVEVERDASLSQRELAERLDLSLNACWRRLKRLQQIGVLQGSRSILDREALGFNLTVFVMIKTQHHSGTWAKDFRSHVESIPEIVEFHRIGGEWDYLLRVVTTNMAGYDRVYRQLIEKFDLATVTGHFSMETIFEGRPLMASVMQ